MSVKDDLYELERELANGDGDTYRRHLTDEAVVVVPGTTMNKAETAEAMDASAGWDDFTYTALMGSVYVRRDGAWKMAFHQQTPLT